MRSILGLDVDKFKSLARLYDPDPATAAARFATVHTYPPDLRAHGD